MSHLMRGATFMGIVLIGAFVAYWLAVYALVFLKALSINSGGIP